MRINGLRSLSSVLHGKSWSDEQKRGVSALSATNKMFWSEYHQEAMQLAMDVLGMHGQVLTGDPEVFESVPGYGRRKPAPDYPATALQSSYFFSRSETIWGGSAEIQRNIVGERVLGLPREPR
jgi:alkylation response protein AidB-like acyl-CoA dehydrogenase